MSEESFAVITISNGVPTCNPVGFDISMVKWSAKFVKTISTLEFEKLPSFESVAVICMVPAKL